ncbi:hypothetical protein PVK06_020539 [Gossypium arboreum]|uniref:Uncharacterized protein n=1 Tax=Gossypium arboreum TaxID=29729 RepID=A0ABR0PN26_GOSAR|nr:hypothetical protein PVK06_020539 [Gossypium arboreum]
MTGGSVRKEMEERVDGCLKALEGEGEGLSSNRASCEWRKEKMKQWRHKGMHKGMMKNGGGKIGRGGR